jgi:hypothetical protein
MLVACRRLGQSTKQRGHETAPIHLTGDRPWPRVTWSCARYSNNPSEASINVTRDPLYWSFLVLIPGVFVGLFGYFKADKENFPQGGRPWWLFLVYLFCGWMGAAVGATIVGPLLQISWQLLAGSSTELTWPQPVSMQAVFLFVGTLIGAAIGLVAVLLWRRFTTTAKR